MPLKRSDNKKLCGKRLSDKLGRFSSLLDKIGKLRSRQLLKLVLAKWLLIRILHSRMRVFIEQNADNQTHLHTCECLYPRPSKPSFVSQTKVIHIYFIN